jgi:hypothetical protein
VSFLQTDIIAVYSCGAAKAGKVWNVLLRRSAKGNTERIALGQNE